MKGGARALGVADSYAPEADTTTVAGAIVRADRVFDGIAFGRMTVGGTDSTDCIVELFQQLERPDVQYVFIAGIAPAWYNIIDLKAVAAAVDRPVISVSFEESEGLEPALCEAFTGSALTERRTLYDRQPVRRELSVNGERLFVRSVGLTDTESARIVEAFTPEGGRPEPVRVAHTAANAADQL